MIRYAMRWSNTMTGNMIIGMISLVLLAAVSYTSGASPEDHQAENFTLDIFGNANMDGTIDQKDIEYVESVISGSNPATNLSDANYDGKIDSQDIEQIKDIMDGTETNLTIVDTVGRIVTVAEPVEGIASFYPYSIDVVQMLGESDKMVLVSSSIRNRTRYYPDISKLPAISRPYDYEDILSKKPNLAITYRTDVLTNGLDNKLPGVPVVILEFLNEDAIKGEVLKLGYILGKEERARDYVDNFYDKYTNLIRTRTSGLSEEDKPTVYMEYSKPWHTYGTGSENTIVRIAGGRNVFSDIDKYEADIDPESVVARNPDIITRRAYSNAAVKNVSYESDDTSDVKSLRDEILSRPELANVNAVKNQMVYVDDGNIATGIQIPIAIAYCAKLLQPELFSDLDPEAIQQEFLSKYCSLDYNLNEHGIFFYPPLDVNGNAEGVPDKLKEG